MAANTMEGDELAARRQRRQKPPRILFEGERLYSREEMESIFYASKMTSDSFETVIDQFDYHPPVA